MASVLSAELRGRVVAAIGAGASRQEAARRFEISPVSAVRWRAAVVQEGRTGGFEATHEADWRSTHVTSQGLIPLPSSE